MFAGCSGGDDDDDAAENDAVTTTVEADDPKAAFIAEADAICAETDDAQLDLLARADVDRSDPEATAAFFSSEMLPPFREMIDALAELEPPAGDEELIEDFITGFYAATEEFEIQLEDDPEAALAAEDDPFTPVSDRMRDYGFDACAGFGEPGSQEEADPAAKAAYIAEADRHCAEMNEQYVALFDAVDLEALPPEELAEIYLAEGVPLIRDLLAGLRSLDPPAADADTLAAIYDDIEAGLALVVGELEDDPASIAELDGDPFADANARMADYGFEVCGQG